MKYSHQTIVSPMRPAFGEAARTWLRIALLSFGGPAAQIALMHRVLVEDKRWLTEAQFLHALNFCMLLPGPEAQQLATYAGWRLHGWRGGIVAGTLFVVPGFAVMLGLSVVYALYGNVDAVAGLFFGLKAAVLAIVVEALLRIGRRALTATMLRAIAAAAFVALFFLHLPFPLVIAAAALMGFARARFGPSPPAHGAVDIEEGLAVAHPLRRSIVVILLGGALWAGLPLLAIVLLGGAGAYSAIAVFFSKMALVTFGGAYAVLAYVAQAAVGTLHWLDPGDMLNGLALAETTPGPLILVLTFVGFLAGYRDAGSVAPLAGGVIGAVIATWVTFVPCFIWVFLGAPFMEGLRANRALSGALAAVTAAVVGVIFNLALWFGLHTLFREVAEYSWGPVRLAMPNLTSLDLRAAAIAVLAIVLIFTLRIGIVPVLAACGVAGLALRFV